MSLKDDFPEFMTQTVSIAKFLRDTGRQDVFDVAVNYPCEIQESIVRVENEDGTVFVSNARIYLDGSVSVDMRDRITYNGKTPVIIKVMPDQEFGVPYSTTIFV